MMIDMGGFFALLLGLDMGGAKSKMLNNNCYRMRRILVYHDVSCQ